MFKSFTSAGYCRECEVGTAAFAATAFIGVRCTFAKICAINVFSVPDEGVSPVVPRYFKIMCTRQSCK